MIATASVLLMLALQAKVTPPSIPGPSPQVALEIATNQARQAGGQPVSPAFENVGPDSFGGRTRSLVVVQGGPGSPEVLLAGSAGGGLWRSRNAGESWESVPELRQQSVTSLVA